MRRRKKQLLLLQICFEFLAVKCPNFHLRLLEPVFVLLHLKMMLLPQEKTVTQEMWDHSLGGDSLVNL